MKIEQPKRRIARPLVSGKCWVQIRIDRVGNRAFSKSYTHCSRNAREGKLTCAQHDSHDADARWESAYSRFR